MRISQARPAPRTSTSARRASVSFAPLHCGRSIVLGLDRALICAGFLRIDANQEKRVRTFLAGQCVLPSLGESAAALGASIVAGRRAAPYFEPALNRARPRAAARWPHRHIYSAAIVPPVARPSGLIKGGGLERGQTHRPQLRAYPPPFLAGSHFRNHRPQPARARP